MFDAFDFVIGFAHNFEIIFTIVGFILFFLGFKLIRYFNLCLGFFIGYSIGYLVGLFFISDIIGMLIGALLGTSIAFFSFFYHQYLKGVNLTIWSLILCIYVSIGFFGVNVLGFLIIFPIVLAVTLGVLNHIKEPIITAIVTSFLGSLMVINNLFPLDIGLFSIAIGSVIALIGISFQLLIEHKLKTYDKVNL